MNSHVEYFPFELRRARKEAKLSMTELARRIGATRMTIYRYENGMSFPSPGVLALICGVLHDSKLYDAYFSTDPEANQRHMKDNINLITLQNILNNGKPDFIERLANTALLYQKLNNEGIDKAIGQIELIARIPECQYHK